MMKFLRLTALLMLCATTALAQQTGNNGASTGGGSSGIGPAVANDLCIFTSTTNCTGTAPSTGYLNWTGSAYAFTALPLTCAIAGSTSGQVCTSTGTSTAPTFQSGTTYPGLPSDPSAIAATDLIAIYNQANTELATVTPPILSLYVGTDNLGGSGTSITPSCAVEDNYGTFTATGGTFTVNAPTGCTAAEGQKLLLHLKDTNAQTYSWNAAYVGGTTALPTTSSGSSKGDWIAFRYDSINSKWDYVATATGF